jgi:hypothetical protein
MFGTANELPNVAPSWNVAPTKGAAVVRRRPDTGDRLLDLLKWGLLPHWTKNQPGPSDRSTRVRIRRQSPACFVARCRSDAASSQRTHSRSGRRSRAASSHSHRSSGWATDGVRRPVGELPLFRRIERRHASSSGLLEVNPRPPPTHQPADSAPPSSPVRCTS